MAKIYEFSEEQEKIWNDWVAERPLIIRALCQRFQPNCIYLHKRTGQIVIPSAFDEDNTVQVIVARRLNGGIFPTKNVFGVDPDVLEEIPYLPHDLSLMSFEDFQNFIE